MQCRGDVILIGRQGLHDIHGDHAAALCQLFGNADLTLECFLIGGFDQGFAFFAANAPGLLRQIAMQVAQIDRSNGANAATRCHGARQRVR